jgi:hypothetical protein
MWENIYANKNIDFHIYVINIHSFDPKPACDLQMHPSLFNRNMSKYPLISHNEPTPTSAPSTRCPLLLSYGWT